MRVAQISDTHIGLTTEGQLRAMFRKLKEEQFDLLIHCGDYCGTLDGAKCVARTVKWMREYFPTVPILSTIGNHDFWSQAKYPERGATLHSYMMNYDEMCKTFAENKVHFLDEDDLYTHPDFPEFVFCGVSGWYSHPHPPTNDKLYLPKLMEGNTNHTLLRRSELAIERQMELLDSMTLMDGPKQLIFVSHFPVVNVPGDDHFEAFSWSERISELFIEKYQCRHFLCGHAHQLHKGPLRYECGPDYMKPTYQIITL